MSDNATILAVVCIIVASCHTRNPEECAAVCAPARVEKWAPWSCECGDTVTVEEPQPPAVVLGVEEE